MGFHVNVSDLTLHDLERSNQGHPQIKLNIFNFILSTLIQIALILKKRVPWIGLYQLCTLGGAAYISVDFMSNFVIFSEKYSKIFFSWTTAQNCLIFGRHVSKISLYQKCSKQIAVIIFLFFMIFFALAHLHITIMGLYLLNGAS